MTLQTPDLTDECWRRASCIGLVGIGASLAVVHAEHVFLEEALVTAVIGGVIPLGLSVLVAAIGLAGWRRAWSGAFLARLLGWLLVGMAWMTVAAIGVIWYELVEGATLTHVRYLFVIFATYGSVPALVTGWYDGQRRQRLVDLRETTRALERNRDHLARTETLADVGGWEFDLDDESLRWTDGARRLHGVPGTYEPTLDDALAFFHPEDRAEVERAIEACRDVGGPFELEARLVTDEGRTRWVQMTGERDRRNGTAVLQGAIRDITTRKQREQRLMVLHRILRHNLRNSLTAIMGYAGALRREFAELRAPEASNDEQSSAERPGPARGTDEESTSPQSALADGEDLAGEGPPVPSEAALTAPRMIVEKARELVEVVEKAQKVERCAPEDRTTEVVAVRPLVVELAETYRDAFPAASIEVDAEAASIRGDPETVRCIVDELLENALDHADRDSPRVSVRVRTEGADSVAIVVSDTGPGIPGMERRTIERGEETPLMHGSGIGLWLVNWLVTRLGGTVSIEDNVPRGTTVTVELPAAERTDVDDA